MGVRIEIPEGARHEDIVAAIAALPWDERNAVIGAALCQWYVDYKGEPGYVIVRKPAQPHPRRRPPGGSPP